MVSQAGTLPKAIRVVSLTTPLSRSRDGLAARIQEPIRVEVRGVVTISRGIMMALPKIRNAYRSFGDKHSVIPIILRRSMWDRNRDGRAPSENFSNNGLYIREARSI